MSKRRPIEQHSDVQHHEVPNTSAEIMHKITDNTVKVSVQDGVEASGAIVWAVVIGIFFLALTLIKLKYGAKIMAQSTGILKARREKRIKKKTRKRRKND